MPGAIAEKNAILADVEYIHFWTNTVRPRLLNPCKACILKRGVIFAVFFKSL